MTDPAAKTETDSRVMDADYDVILLLRKCYAIEAKSGYDSENLIVRLLSGRSTRFGVLGRKEEAIIENAYLMQKIRGIVRLPERNIIDCYYTVPKGRLEPKKEFFCAMVGEDISRSLDIHKWYVVDVTREWSHLRKRHHDKWWADYLGVKYRKIKMWKYGENSCPGILRTLDKRLHEAHRQIEAAL